MSQLKLKKVKINKRYNIVRIVIDRIYRKIYRYILRYSIVKI